MIIFRLTANTVCRPFKSVDTHDRIFLTTPLGKNLWVYFRSDDLRISNNQSQETSNSVPGGGGGVLSVHPSTPIAVISSLFLKDIGCPVYTTVLKQSWECRLTCYVVVAVSTLFMAFLHNIPPPLESHFLPK